MLGATMQAPADADAAAGRRGRLPRVSCFIGVLAGAPYGLLPGLLPPNRTGSQYSRQPMPTIM
jgi:hypothetical protein